MTACHRCGGAGCPHCRRPLAGWATAGMVALAAAALVHLVWAFTPLVSVWAVGEAVRRGGQQPGVLMWLAQAGGAILVLVSQLAVAGCLAVWTYRARVNARALSWTRRPAWIGWAVWFVPVANLVLPPAVVAGATGPRRARRLLWSWWALWLAGLVGVGLGSALTWPPELRAMLSAVAAGDSVPVARADQLLGYQIAGRLPGGVLLVAAAVTGLLAVHRITTGQYDRFDELRSTGVAGATALPGAPGSPVAIPAQPTAAEALDSATSAPIPRS